MLFEIVHYLDVAQPISTVHGTSKTTLKIVHMRNRLPALRKLSLVNNEDHFHGSSVKKLVELPEGRGGGVVLDDKNWQEGGTASATRHQCGRHPAKCQCRNKSSRRLQALQWVSSALSAELTVGPGQIDYSHSFVPHKHGHSESEMLET
jgi:hypothetical protein